MSEMVSAMSYEEYNANGRLSKEFDETMHSIVVILPGQGFGGAAFCSSQRHRCLRNACCPANRAMEKPARPSRKPSFRKYVEKNAIGPAVATLNGVVLLPS